MLGLVVVCVLGWSSSIVLSLVVVCTLGLGFILALGSIVVYGSEMESWENL